MKNKSVNVMKKLIGVVGVDTGQIMICDPCYIDDNWEKEKFTRDKKPKSNFSFNACSNKTIKSKYGFGQIKYKQGTNSARGLAIVSRSGGGDGLYPVYAHIQDGIVVKIEIDFLSERS